jgi:cbb3-type cytochrome oxidase maturation protein
MGIIILLISISITIALTFLGIFYWNMKSGQYDDTYTPSVRMLFDDQPKKEQKGKTNKTTCHDTNGTAQKV